MGQTIAAPIHMKYLRLGLTPTARAVHPVDQFLADRECITRQAILHVDSLPGETTVLYRLDGDAAALDPLLADNPTVLDHEIVADEDGFSLYLRAASEDRESVLTAIAHEHALIVDTPIEITDDGLEATLVGTDDDLRAALTAVPDDVSVRVLKAGPYTPSERRLLEPLTDRQLEVFRTAVDRGYYDLPRRATHKDLAGELDCAPSTVDEHLRKAEARVVSRLVG